jgi:hypothetical protein
MNAAKIIQFHRPAQLESRLESLAQIQKRAPVRPVRSLSETASVLARDWNFRFGGDDDMDEGPRAA